MKTYNLSILILVICLSSLGCGIPQSEASSKIAANEMPLRYENYLHIDSLLPKNTGVGDIGDNIAFLPNYTVWAKGDWNSYSDRLYFYDNQGDSWKNIKIPVDSISVDGDIYFSDSETGWAIGWRRIVTTKNGGRTWGSLDLPKDSKITKPQSLQFLNSQIGFIGGTTSYLNRDESQPVTGLEILCTTNGGEKFNVCYKTNEFSTVFQILAISNLESIALLDGITILATQDRGQTWQKIHLPFKTKFINKGNDGIIWLIDENGNIQYSRDIGQTWNKSGMFSNEFKGNWNSLAFGESGKGIAIGNEGLIAVTYDNGQTWKLQNISIKENLLSVKIQSSKAIIVSEKNLYFIELK